MSIMACSRVVVLVVTFSVFIFTRPDFRDFYRSIRHQISSELQSRFLVYITGHVHVHVATHTYSTSHKLVK